MNRVFGILDIRHVGRRDPTGIRKDSEGVIGDAHESDGGENDGVHNSGRGHEAEPPVDEDEYCREVDEGDCQDDDGDGRRKGKAPLHLNNRKRVREAHRRQGDGGSGGGGELFRWEMRCTEAEEQRLNVGSGGLRFTDLGFGLLFL